VVAILHGSDLQFGRPYLPGVGAAFAGLVRSTDPDVVVVSGDLTQRAKAREFVGVKKLLDECAEWPLVVTPGNHDVPLYRFWERLLDPYRNWRRTFGPDLDTVVRVPGATVVALNSSAPRRAIVAGRLRRRQIHFAEEAFRSTAPGEARIVVTHHHFVPTADGEGGRTLPEARGLLREFRRMGVDVILGGHVHQTHLSSSLDLSPDERPGVPLVACGTTASRRGRGVESQRNSLALVRVAPGEVRVTSYFFESGSGAFEPSAEWTFSPDSDAWTRLRAPGEVGRP